MPVEIRSIAPFSSRIQRARLRRVAERTLRQAQVKATLTLYVTGNAEIRKLNRRFHGTDAPTDVLSFPAEAVPPPRAWARTSVYLGDIVVSYEQARLQAAAAGWHIVDELDLLVVHGLLHLLGYDDLTPPARARMWQQQVKILGRIAGSS